MIRRVRLRTGEDGNCCRPAGSAIGFAGSPGRNLKFNAMRPVTALVTGYIDAADFGRMVNPAETVRRP